MELPHTGLVSFLRDTLRDKGYPDVLEGLPDDADERMIMGRLVELGPGMTEEGDPAADKVPNFSEFEAFVTAGAILQTPAYREDLLSRVRQHAYDPQSPHRQEALQALCSIDPAAAKILEAEQRAVREALAAQARTAVRHTCCGDH